MRQKRERKKEYKKSIRANTTRREEIEKAYSLLS